MEWMDCRMIKQNGTMLYCHILYFHGPSLTLLSHMWSQVKLYRYTSSTIHTHTSDYSTPNTTIHYPGGRPALANSLPQALHYTQVLPCVPSWLVVCSSVSPTSIKGQRGRHTVYSRTHAHTHMCTNTHSLHTLKTKNQLDLTNLLVVDHATSSPRDSASLGNRLLIWHFCSIPAGQPHQHYSANAQTTTPVPFCDQHSQSHWRDCQGSLSYASAYADHAWHS